jgi:hypothetical protein
MKYTVYGKVHNLLNRYHWLDRLEISVDERIELLFKIGKYADDIQQRFKGQDVWFSWEDGTLSASHPELLEWLHTMIDTFGEANIVKGTLFLTPGGSLNQIPDSICAFDLLFHSEPYILSDMRTEGELPPPPKREELGFELTDY